MQPDTDSYTQTCGEDLHHVGVLGVHFRLLEPRSLLLLLLRVNEAAVISKMVTHNVNLQRELKRPLWNLATYLAVSAVSSAFVR